jgi:hypothetical protein
MKPKRLSLRCFLFAYSSAISTLHYPKIVLENSYKPDGQSKYYDSPCRIILIRARFAHGFQSPTRQGVHLLSLHTPESHISAIDVMRLTHARWRTRLVHRRRYISKYELPQSTHMLKLSVSGPLPILRRAVGISSPFPKSGSTCREG